MAVGMPRRGRWNEEGAWGIGIGRISEGLGAFGAWGISKGLEAWAPSRNVVFPFASFERGKKR